MCRTWATPERTAGLEKRISLGRTKNRVPSGRTENKQAQNRESRTGTPQGQPRTKVQRANVGRAHCGRLLDVHLSMVRGGHGGLTARKERRMSTFTLRNSAGGAGSHQADVLLVTVNL